MSRIRTAPSRLLFVLILAAMSCAPARPIVICVVENPVTHERATMYKEDPFKVPRDYDQARHIARWKAERAQQGFTVEVQH